MKKKPTKKFSSHTYNIFLSVYRKKYYFFRCNVFRRKLSAVLCPLYLSVTLILKVWNNFLKKHRTDRPRKVIKQGRTGKCVQVGIVMQYIPSYTVALTLFGKIQRGTPLGTYLVVLPQDAPRPAALLLGQLAQRDADGPVELPPDGDCVVVVVIRR